MKSPIVASLAVAMTTFVFAAPATALFIPPGGSIKFRPSGAQGVFTAPGGTDADGDVSITHRQRAPLTPSIVVSGDQQFLAMGLGNYDVDGDDAEHSPTAQLTLITTFLEVGDVNFIGSLGALGIVDSTRPHTTAGPDPATGLDTIGRFFIVEGTAPPAALFLGPGGRTADVDFSTGSGTGSDADNLLDGFNADLLSNFTTGAILATGSFVPAIGSGPNGGLVNFFFPSADTGMSYNGIFPASRLLIDGGAWFDLGITKGAGFQANTLGWDGSVTNYDAIPSAAKGDRFVFNTGWHATMDGVLQFQARPQLHTLIDEHFDIGQDVTNDLGFSTLANSPPGSVSIVTNIFKSTDGVLQLAQTNEVEPDPVSISKPLHLGDFFYVEFDYRFLTDGDLAILLDDTILETLTAPASGAGRDTFQFFFRAFELPDLALSSGLFDFELRLSGGPDSTILINDLYTSTNPEPSTLSLLALLAPMVFKRRRRR